MVAGSPAKRSLQSKLYTNCQIGSCGKTVPNEERISVKDAANTNDSSSNSKAENANDVVMINARKHWNSTTTVKKKNAFQESTIADGNESFANPKKLSCFAPTVIANTTFKQRASGKK